MKKKNNLSWLDASKLVLNTIDEAMCQTQVLQKISDLGLKDTRVPNSGEIVMRTLLTNSTGKNPLFTKVDDQKFIINPNHKSAVYNHGVGHLVKRQLPQRKKTKAISDDFVDSDSIVHAREEKVSYSPYTAQTIDHLRKNKRMRTARPVITPKPQVKPCILLKESLNMTGEPSGGSRETMHDMFNGNSDIMKYDAISKKCINIEEFTSLTKCQQRYLASHLPASDVRKERNTIRLLPSALTNPFFVAFFREWQDRLGKGELSADYDTKVRTELDKQVNKHPWKESFFEDVWGFNHSQVTKELKTHKKERYDTFEDSIKEALTSVPPTFFISPAPVLDPIIESLTPPTSDGSEHDRTHITSSDLIDQPTTPTKMGADKPLQMLTPDHEMDHSEKLSPIPAGEPSQTASEISNSLDVPHDTSLDNRQSVDPIDIDLGDSNEDSLENDYDKVQKILSESAFNDEISLEPDKEMEKPDHMEPEEDSRMETPVSPKPTSCESEPEDVSRTDLNEPEEECGSESPKCRSESPKLPDGETQTLTETENISCPESQSEICKTESEQQPKESLHEATEESLHVTPEESLHVTPEESLHVTPEESLHEATEESLHVAPKESLHVAPEEVSHEEPDVIPHDDSDELTKNTADSPPREEPPPELSQPAESPLREPIKYESEELSFAELDLDDHQVLSDFRDKAPISPVIEDPDFVCDFIVDKTSKIMPEKPIIPSFQDKLATLEEPSPSAMSVEETPPKKVTKLTVADDISLNIMNEIKEEFKAPPKLQITESLKLDGLNGVRSPFSAYDSSASSASSSPRTDPEKRERLTLKIRTKDLILPPDAGPYPLKHKKPKKHKSKEKSHKSSKKSVEINNHMQQVYSSHTFGIDNGNQFGMYKPMESEEDANLNRISLQQQLLAEKGIKSSTPVLQPTKNYLLLKNMREKQHCQALPKLTKAPNHEEKGSSEPMVVLDSGSQKYVFNRQQGASQKSIPVIKDNNMKHLKQPRSKQPLNRSDSSESIRSALKAKINQRRYTDIPPINLDHPPPQYTPLSSGNHCCYVAKGSPGECVCSTAPMLFCTKCYHLSHSSCSNVLCSNCGALFKFN